MKACFWKTLLCAAAVLLAAACTHEMKTAVAADEGVIPLEGYEDIGCRWSYSMEYVSGGVSRSVADGINRTIARAVCSQEEENTSADVPAACLQWIDGIQDEYYAFADEVLPELDVDDEPWMMGWWYDQAGAFSGGCEARHLCTYSINYEDYTGGAHGMRGNYYYVFDTKTGAQVTEEDLFAEDCDTEALEDLIYDRLLEGLDEEAWQAVYERPSLNGNFSVDEDGITWWYNAYEIAPYVLGTLSSTLSWDELAPFLK